MASAAEAVARHLGTDRGAASRLARAVGMSRGFVSNVLSGRAVPSDPVKWADGLNLTGEARAAFLRDLASDRQAPEVRAAIAMRATQPSTTYDLDRLAPGLVEATARIVALQRQVDALRARLDEVRRLCDEDDQTEDDITAAEVMLDRHKPNQHQQRPPASRQTRTRDDQH